jgi:ribonuclease P protein component
MLGRLVHRADFECLLALPPRWRSAHFAIHHATEGPPPQVGVSGEVDDSNLSTEDSPTRNVLVDNSCPTVRLGFVIPKRHARRAVTRNLIRRLARSVFGLHAAALPPGRWLLRLRAPFATRTFASASSVALRRAVRTELELLVEAAARCATVGAA